MAQIKYKMNYHDKRWKSKRAYILSRDNFECRESARYGLSVLANTVHHIYPVDLYPELAWTDWNLLSCTIATHNTFHDRDTNEIIGAGLYWQRRFKRRFERTMKELYHDEE